MTTPTTWPGLGFDPAPGDPAGVNGLVTQLSTTARYLQETHDTLTELTRQQGAWRGDASKAFTETLDVLPRYLIDAHESLRKAGDVLGQWNGTLGGLQGRARDLEGQAVTARTDLVSAEDAERQARAHPDFGLIGQTFSAQDLPVAQSRIDAAQAGLDRAVSTASSLRTSLEDLLRRAGDLGLEHEDAARGAANGVRGADDGLAPPEPGWFDQAVGWVGDNLAEIGDVAGIVAAVAGTAALFPPLAPVAAPIALIAGGVALLAHGADFVVNDKWDDGPSAYLTLGADVAGLVPGVRALGAAYDGGRFAFTTTVGLRHTVTGAAETYGREFVDGGPLSRAVAEQVAPAVNRILPSANGVDPVAVARGVEATTNLVPQVPIAADLLSEEGDFNTAKDASATSIIGLRGANEVQEGFIDTLRAFR